MKPTPKITNIKVESKCTKKVEPVISSDSEPSFIKQKPQLWSLIALIKFLILQYIVNGTKNNLRAPKNNYH